MNVTRSLEDMRQVKNSVITVGTFDGVHLAHREIIREVVHRARMREGRSVVVTFDPHPKSVVASTRGPVQLLTTSRERIALLGSLHLDEVVVIPFDHEFSRIPASAFLKDIIAGIIGVSEIVVGYDHTFGRDREAGTQDLIHRGRELDFSVFAVHPLTLDGEPISSTRIRRALMAGDLERAEHMLGYQYRLTGTVVNGDHRGRTIGFPTANIMPEDPHKLVPANGVYLVAVELHDELHYGMMNIGVRPTVTSGTLRVLEVHILDFDRDIYGETMTVTFLKRLREEQKFGTLEELIVQLSRDREAVRQARLSVTYSPTKPKE
jgi:riboflavin kinase / FMN adenylyltransferase